MVVGKLDKKITIEQPVYGVSDTTNQKEISSWSTYKSCYARDVHDQSSEVFEEGQLVLKDVHKWTIRYYDASAIANDMRISYDSEYYYIIGYKELGRKEGYLITTIKRDNQ